MNKNASNFNISDENKSNKNAFHQQIKEEAQKINGHLEEHKETFMNALEGVKSKFCETIEAKPLSSVLIAGGIGFLLSFVLRQNHHHKQ
ncbi:hypothetical protein [Legionella septentrionalis]|nr:hypothetical protein [Legionella septentrionalis]RUR02388.1 hypothetical protein ELY11_01275 [Legionella septentrionalis]RUR10331.1 hypothetical protein ELY14_05520 [Legionella septentrionalis]